MSSNLEHSIQEFDGIAVSILSEARAACRDRPGYFEELIRLSIDPRPHISVGATWILKAEADDGTRFGSEMIDRLVEALENIPSWEAKFHICQSIDAFDITPEQAGKFFSWATSLADHSRPFLRAWSLHATVIIGMKFNEFRGASETVLTIANGDKAASVRARARNLKQLLRARKDKT